MKRIGDMSKAEVLALTNEQIEKLIDYECALEGVPLLPPEPIKPNVPKFEPDITVYEVAGYVFKTAEEARAVLEAFNAGTPYKIGWGDNLLKPLETYERIKIESKKAMSPETYERIKVEKAAADAAMKEYEANKKEYDKAVELRKRQVEYVLDIVNEAREEQRKKERYMAEFNRYLALADGNRDIAWRFLVNAHNDVEEIEGLKDELLIVTE